MDKDDRQIQVILVAIKDLEQEVQNLWEQNRAYQTVCIKILELTEQMRKISPFNKES